MILKLWSLMIIYFAGRRKGTMGVHTGGQLSQGFW